MATTLPNVGKTGRYGDLKRRLLFLLGALIVFRIGAHIPVPGIDPNVLADLFKGQQGGILGMFNMFSGGALSRFTIFALGIMPYISASIIMQLMTAVSPQLDQLRKEGESGRRKITQYTRYGTVLLALFQATGISFFLQGQQNLVLNPGFVFQLTTVTTLVTGTMFLMWLGEQITERGLGNGISIIIFAGIAAGLPNAIAGTLELVRTGAMHPLTAILIAVAVVAVTAFVCFVERGQRKILVNYAKRQVGNRVYGGQSSHLPFKLNMSGVIPPIFASSLLLLPTTLTGFSGASGPEWLNTVNVLFGPGRPLWLAVYVAMIVFFAFFYTAIVFNPQDTAENLRKYGGFVPGIDACSISSTPGSERSTSSSSGTSPLYCFVSTRSWSSCHHFTTPIRRTSASSSALCIVRKPGLSRVKTCATSSVCCSAILTASGRVGANSTTCSAEPKNIRSRDGIMLCTVSRTRVITTFNAKIADAEIRDYIFFARPDLKSGAIDQARQYFAQGHEITFVDVADWLRQILVTIGSDGRQLFVERILEALREDSTPGAMKVTWNSVATAVASGQ